MPPSRQTAALPPISPLVNYAERGFGANRVVWDKTILGFPILNPASILAKKREANYHQQKAPFFHG